MSLPETRRTLLTETHMVFYPPLLHESHRLDTLLTILLHSGRPVGLFEKSVRTGSWSVGARLHGEENSIGGQLESGITHAHRLKYWLTERGGQSPFMHLYIYPSTSPSQ